MSLIGALNVGTSALVAQQAALQVTSNNISNAGNADYTRQVAGLVPAGEQEIKQGMFLGQGVELDSIQRQIDASLQGRLNSATSDSSSASAGENYLGQVETSINALGDTNVSTQLTGFFGSWSKLANDPQNASLRQVVIQSGQSTAQAFTGLRSQITDVQTSATAQLGSDVKTADGLAQQVADLNVKIVTAQDGTQGSANSLLDQRDAAITKLSKLMDVSTVAQPDGTLSVYVGSEILVLAGRNRGLTLNPAGNATNAGTPGTPPAPTISFKDNKGTATVTSGEIGGLLSAQQKIGRVVTQLDAQANSLIFELNKLHSSGQGLNGFSSLTSTTAVNDPAAALSDPATGLPNAPSNGSFVVHVTDKATGLSTSTLVKVSLTGNAATDTTLNSLTTELAGINGVTATVANGRLTVGTANAGQEISFSQDSSGTLAALGVNTFFTGKDATDIAVNTTLQNDPSLLAAAKNSDSGDNQTARAIAALNTQQVASLNGSSLNDAYASMVTGVANASAGAKSDATAASAVVSTLTNQRQALSGVSLDEEAVNMIQQQNAYQAAARLITTVNNMMITLMNMAA